MAKTIESKMEELKDAVRRQEEFTANFAHELKTPMTSIIGYADTLYQKTLSPGEALAKKIQEKLNENLEVERPREIKGNTTYYLLKRSPGVLNIVECGFLTNPEEAASLSSEEYQEKVAQAIADGVKEYIEETL